MEKPIFIVGLPRSGSTLWHNIFAESNTLCRMGEMHYISPVRKDFRYFIKHYAGNLSKSENIRKMFELLFSGEKKKGIAEGFWTFDLPEAGEDVEFREALIKKVSESDRTLKAIFKIIVEEFVSYKKKARCCIKFPLYVNHIPKLIQWYPDCKVVHITRDPRAMAVSRKNDPGGTRKKVGKYPYLAFLIKGTMVLFVVFQYVWTSRLHKRYARYPNYKLFRYEDLLSDPKNTILELCEHTEVEYTENMLHPKKGQASSITDEKRGGFDKSAAYRWKNHIGKNEYRVITFLTKKGMKRFGYKSQ